ncbi:39S ribosomal protein L52, mitochondrial [Strongylocentrotus purpuratus]|uniref:Large ribosomal subunit protein mL52 n=1 Tax=Strongylocentrotus purpuratus TaxID=7668 RepID=A0A7M7G3M6_STRPU|nr:39S ribosomal protein L52, mitochondrial [Strongylocentrotus purpuratus]
MLHLAIQAACASCRPAVRHLSSTSSCMAGKRWRESQGLGRSGNEYGPLTDNPDWSYADGRPAPPQPNQLRRKEEQRELAERIDILSKEMLQGKVKYQDKLDAKRRHEEMRAERRLKPKGSAWKQEDYVERRRTASSKKMPST